MRSLTAGHFATDLSQGSLAALLVFLVPKLDLSYTLAAAVVLVAHLQPPRSSSRRSASGRTAAGRCGCSLPAWCSRARDLARGRLAELRVLLLVAVLVSGIGVAAFHPEGSKFASYVSGSRRASGMAVFSVGGRNLASRWARSSASSSSRRSGSRAVSCSPPGLVVAALLVAGGLLSRRFDTGRRAAGCGTIRGGGSPARVRVLLG